LLTGGASRTRSSSLIISSTPPNLGGNARVYSSTTYWTIVSSSRSVSLHELAGVSRRAGLPARRLRGVEDASYGAWLQLQALVLVVFKSLKGQGHPGFLRRGRHVVKRCGQTDACGDVTAVKRGYTTVDYSD
jgi:hypothetical protein